MSLLLWIIYSINYRQWTIFSVGGQTITFTFIVFGWWQKSQRQMSQNWANTTKTFAWQDTRYDMDKQRNSYCSLSHASTQHWHLHTYHHIKVRMHQQLLYRSAVSDPRFSMCCHVQHFLYSIIYHIYHQVIYWLQIQMIKNCKALNSCMQTYLWTP